MKPDVIVVGPRDRKVIAENDHRTLINTTSRSQNWSSGLSPFFCGPCYLYGTGRRARFAMNVENMWQYSKVYEKHDDNGKPNADWFKWSSDGFCQAYADRYPMGKGARPVYSWDGENALTYVQARERLYVPLYQSAVRGTEAFYQLRKLSRKEPLMLWDFDGYHDPKATFPSVLKNPNKKMGHAFVLQAMLMISPFFDSEGMT